MPKARPCHGSSKRSSPFFRGSAALPSITPTTRSTVRASPSADIPESIRADRRVRWAGGHGRASSTGWPSGRGCQPDAVNWYGAGEDDLEDEDEVFVCPDPTHGKPLVAFTCREAATADAAVG